MFVDYYQVFPLRRWPCCYCENHSTLLQAVVCLSLKRRSGDASCELVQDERPKFINSLRVESSRRFGKIHPEVCARVLCARQPVTERCVCLVCVCVFSARFFIVFFQIYLGLKQSQIPGEKKKASLTGQQGVAEHVYKIQEYVSKNGVEHLGFFA